MEKARIVNTKYFAVKEYEQLLLEFNNGKVFSLIFGKQDNGLITASPQFFYDEREVISHGNVAPKATN